MAAIIEIKYFNSYILKHAVDSTSQQPRWNGSKGIPEVLNGFPRFQTFSYDDTFIVEESRIPCTIY